MFKTSTLLRFQKAVPEVAHPQGYFKVTLTRSPIGLPPKTRNAVKSLGLYKLNQTVFKVRSEVSCGHIFKIKELVKVENVDKIQWEDRRPKDGFVIIRDNSSVNQSL